MSNPKRSQPFGRICLVVILYVTVVYVSFYICKWLIAEVMSTEPAMFIFLNVILFIVDVTLLLLSIEEARDYIKG